MKIIISGLESVGKSTIGKLLAKELGLHYYIDMFPALCKSELVRVGIIPEKTPYRKVFKLAEKKSLIPILEIKFYQVMTYLLEKVNSGVFDRGPIDAIFYYEEEKDKPVPVQHFINDFKSFIEGKELIFVYVPFNKEAWRKRRKGKHRRTSLHKLKESDMIKRELKFLELYRKLDIQPIIAHGRDENERVKKIMEGIGID